MPEVLEILAALAAVIVAAVVVVMIAIPVCRGIGWVIRQIFRFVTGEIRDAFRLIGAIILGIVYVPLIVLNLLIGRWSACGHYGRALQGECGTVGMCAYRMVIGHPVRLVGLSGLTEGLERRLPAVVQAAPTSDTPSARTGQFEGYKIVGSLAGGGSGAKLYIAEPDQVKAAALQRDGLGHVGQVVIKSFSLKDGSSLPQIVRESRSLDAAKRMGLILDHELSPERFYYVMRYVPGESLSLTTKKLHATSPQTGLGDAQLRAALGIECDLVSTLSTYHQGGLWHKDVKPDNIIIDGGSRPRAHLVDFGLVSSLRSAMTLTTHGTEYFRDPELVRMALKGVKVHEVDGTRFDIYAAGAVLYSMVEDSFPAHGVLSNVTRRCPDAVKWIIRRAMTDYDKRYTSADAMLADLQCVAAAADPFAVKPVELPSMSGMGGAFRAEPEPANPQASVPPAAEGVAAAASPIPPRPGFRAHDWNPDPAPAQGRRAPKLRVANWWSGRTEVEPGPAPGPAQAPRDFASMVGDMAERSVRNARAAVNAAVEGVQAGWGVNAARGPIRHTAQEWQPKPGPRAKAREQLTRARARVTAARERARARIGVRGLSFGRSGNSGNKGIALALIIFLGGALLVGGVITKNHRQRQRIFFDGRAPVLVENSADRTATIRPQPIDGEADIPFPAHVDARVLIINDIRRPWGDKVTNQVDALMGRFAAADITPVHEGAGKGAMDKDDYVNLEANARLVLDGTQTPADAPEAPAKFAKWFKDAQPDLDAVVWIMQPAGAESPRVFVFTPDASADKAAAITQVAKAPSVKTRG